MREVIIASIFDQKMDLTTKIFEVWSWFKFSDMGLALGRATKFYNNVAKGLKLKVKKFCWLIPTFVEVIKEKLVGGPLNRSKQYGSEGDFQYVFEYLESDDDKESFRKT